MKLISWNVNGLRACLTHDFAASFAALDADIFSVQETKMQPGQADFAPEGYTEYTYSAEKKGYSGTACWCRQPPLAVTTGIGILVGGGLVISIIVCFILERKTRKQFKNHEKTEDDWSLFDDDEDESE